MSTHRYRCRHSRRGVSALELIVVLLLVTASVGAASLIMPGPSSTDMARESAAAFAAALREARDSAVKDHHITTVMLDQTRSPSRWIFAATAGFQGQKREWELPIEGNVKIEGTNIPIRIDDHGNASYFGQWTFTCENKFNVTLQPIGANVTLKSAE